jgi:anti-anti-sigma factor
MVNILRQENITVIDLGPEYSGLDENNLGKIAQQIIELAKHATPPLVVFDLSQTDLFGSYFIQFLIRTWKLVKKRGGTVVLAGLNDQCQDVLHRAKIEVIVDGPDPEIPGADRDRLSRLAREAVARVVAGITSPRRAGGRDQDTDGSVPVAVIV